MVSTRSSSRPADTPPIYLSSTKSQRTTTTNNTTTTKAAPADAWHHAPSSFTLLWLAISLPLVIWDTVYILCRPLTMEGGSMHWPLWVPYRLYGEVDHIYGWKAFHAHNGFSSAQGFLNAIETTMYLAYLYMTYGQGAWKAGGRRGATAVLVGFSAAIMTLSKTVLYWANEYFSGFDNIGHNTWGDLILLWIIPNGAWLVGSTGMIWTMGGNIIDGLTAASGRSKRD
ncbi:hypothetical protein ACO1O0_001476 [Amphichorda felina]